MNIRSILTFEIFILIFSRLLELSFINQINDYFSIPANILTIIRNKNNINLSKKKPADSKERI